MFTEKDHIKNLDKFFSSNKKICKSCPNYAEINGIQFKLYQAVGSKDEILMERYREEIKHIHMICKNFVYQWSDYLHYDTDRLCPCFIYGPFEAMKRTHSKLEEIGVW